MAIEPYQSPFVDEVEVILDDEWLYRRIYPGFIDWQHRDANGSPRVKGGAFQDYGDEQAEKLGYEAPAMSVAVRCLVEALTGPAHLLATFSPAYGLVAFTAGEARALNQGVMWRPVVGEPWHAIVFDKAVRRRKSSAQSALALAATQRWVVVPPETMA
jgi:hypothetical protein